MIDPYIGIEEEYDVAFKEGKVAKIDKNISENEGEEVFNAEGNILSPGLIDLHTHVYWGVSHFGINADSTCLKNGVTTVIDAGSSGALNFLGFKKFIIEKSQTRILPFLHISSVGLTLREGVGELVDFRNLDFSKAIEVGRENSDIIIGIKIRIGESKVGDLSLQALILAKEAAKRLGVPLMVHPSRSKFRSEEITGADVLPILEKGDIFTHCFSPIKPNLSESPLIFNQKEEIIDDAWDAAKRGVVFDVGHGRGSFGFYTAEKALKQGFLPDTISTDLHAHNINHPVYDMPTTLSKFMNMDFSLRKVIELGTTNPSSVIGMDGKIGTLKEGAEGDAIVLKIEKGKFTFWDVLNKKRIGKERIRTVAVFKKGKQIY